MMDNPEFNVDKFSDAYIMRHPHMKKQLMKEKQIEEERLEKELRLNKKKKLIEKDRKVLGRKKNGASSKNKKKY